MAYILLFLLFLSALVVHEYAHGWTANKLGDPTAKRFGRLTFNPIAHIDPIGTILLPVFLLLMRSPVVFGWAKPVPINYSFLKNPKKDMFWVGIAGPLANLSTAVLLAGALKIPFLADIFIIKILFSHSAFINIILAVFNMLPIPPLDGSRVLFSILPQGAAVTYIKLEPFGMFILLALLWMGIANRFILPAASFLMKFLGI